MLATTTTTTVNIERPLPVLEDYEISPITGFTPHEIPLVRLTQAYYQPWENIADHLNDLTQSKKLRDEVHKLPVLGTDQLETVRERRRAYQVLCFIAHSYLWGDRATLTPQVLPAALAVPWTQVAHSLGIPPILTYAASNVWNWTLKDKNGPFELQNLKSLFTMTGTNDEDWFYIVAVAVEMAGGAALQPLLEAVQAARDNDVATVKHNMRIALTHLQRVAGLLARMFESCDPAVFYWQIRPFIQGTEPNAELGLPNGLIYEGVMGEDGMPETKKLMGTTAGQSSLFPTLDIFYGIEHDSNPPSSSSSPSQSNGHTNGSATNGAVDLVARKNRHPLLYKMKQYMPGPHRAFLNHLAEVANLREFVDAHRASDPELVNLYDTSVSQIQEFRSIHIRVATRYIVMQARRGPPVQQKEGEKNPQETAKKQDEEAAAVKEGSGIKGTGGSDLVTFLRGLRDETAASKFE